MTTGVSPSPDAREIRVFISSTFRDMQEEREELVKRVFPELRKLCEERGVTWGEVDLRWGITEEQSEQGRVIPICLEEIQRCRPYFIGLLGERYGWVPDEYPQKLVERQPWLEEHMKRSATELEILHGVLNDPEMEHHAYFYFRDPVYVDALPSEVQADYREGPTEKEIEKFGLEEANRRAAGRREKLAALKERIRESGFPVHEDYAGPVELGELVLEDLTALIERLYPEEEQPGPLDREAAQHEAFAASRARVYVGRQSYSDRLDAHARGDGPPLVVLGESGAGKSALLANWALEYREEHQEELVLMHFIGASPQTAQWRAMVRRLMGEFKRHFDIDAEIPEEPDALRAAFANWLHRAAARGRVVLVLDALNQLEDREGAPDLVWLPPELPDEIRLVVSTLPGRPLEALEKRGWPTLTVEPLTFAEREELIDEYLTQYTKTLSSPRSQRIAAAPKTANPLYLRALLEELRVFGVFEQLDQRIGYYLEAPSIPALYQKILNRYEEDYERDRPGLVGEAMSLLWAARRGLSESELLDLLGTGRESLPQAYWSPLYLAAEGSLVDRAGLLGFAHDYLRQAVQERYLPTEKKRHAAHQRLADYFAGRDLGPRQIDELPWQLEQARSWQRLHDLLSDPNFLKAAWDADPFDVKARWAQLEAHSDLELVEAYRPMLSAPDQYEGYVPYAAILLTETGHIDEALSLQAHLVARYRGGSDPVHLALHLGNHALNLRLRGELDQAEEQLRQQERIYRKLGLTTELADCLGNRALVLYDRGQLQAAMALMEEQERIARQLGMQDTLQAALGNQAVIHKDRGELDRAMALHEKAERICREIGDKGGLQRCLGNQATILQDRGRLDKALELMEQQERICKKLGMKAELVASLGNQGLIHQTRGDLNRAMALHKEAEGICQGMGYKMGLHNALGNQGMILYARGDLSGAMALFRRKEDICRQLEHKAGVRDALGNRAVIAYRRGELTNSMALMKKQEQLCDELGDKAGLASCLGNQALILKNRGDLRRAMELMKRQERLCSALDDQAGLQSCLGNQALVLKDLSRFEEAMVLLEEQQRLCLELGNKSGLVTAIANKALMLANLGKKRRASRLLDEAFRLATDHGLEGLATQVRSMRRQPLFRRGSSLS